LDPKIAIQVISTTPDRALALAERFHSNGKVDQKLVQSYARE